MQVRFGLAVVTGAGAGLGRELALRLARSGAAVLCVDRDGAAADETAGLLEAARTRAWSLQADVTSDDDLVVVAARARDLGGADLLVNNAGGWTPGEQYPLAAAADWTRTLDLNLRAPMRLTQLFLEGLVHRRGRRDQAGAVVNVASSAGVEDAAYGSPEYAAAKAGLVRFTTAMADTQDARVMAVVPGWVGLPRAHEQWAALPQDERDRLPALIPVTEVTTAVLRLLGSGRGGEVAVLTGRS